MCIPIRQARERILRDAIVIGIKSEKAYYKCVEKGSDLTLEEALEIVQSEDSTQCQVELCRQQTCRSGQRLMSTKFQAGKSPWKGGAKRTRTAETTVSRPGGKKKILF